MSSIELSDGDELFVSYSLNMGVDIGSDYNNTNTGLKSLTVENAELSVPFSSDVTDYSLTLDDGKDSIKIIPTAENKYYRYRIYKNDYTPENDNDYKRTQYIPVSDGDVVYIGVGNADWQYVGDNVHETVYELKINSSDEQSKNDESISEEPSEEQKNPTDTDNIINETIQAVKSDGQISEVGNEWRIFALARFGSIDDSVKADYVQNLSEYLAVSEPGKATDTAKYIIVLTSLGYDMTDFNGVNYISYLSDYDFCIRQGLNGAVYSLIALDTKGYEIPASKDGAEQNTREKLIDFILSGQLEDGGWAFFGNSYEPDMTGIVLQSLAPYYDSNENVKTAVDKAVTLLSENQNEDGTYTSYGAPGCENSAQIVCALCSLGIDPASDDRFVKNGGSALDGLCSFYADGEGAFSHTLGGTVNGMSTDQAFYALCAYSRLVKNQTRLYDMTDTNNNENSNASEISEDSEVSLNSEISDSLITDEQSIDDNDNIADNKHNQSQVSNTENSSTPIVETGDSGVIYFVLTLLIISAFTVIFAYRKHKSD